MRDTILAPALRVREISLDWLVARGACEDQISLFRETFGDSPVEVAPETIRQAAEAGVDIDWGVQHILTRRAMIEYVRECDGAWEEYRRACARACDRADARAAYRRAVVDILICIIWGSTTPDA
jgi:hypothetical protein